MALEEVARLYTIEEVATHFRVSRRTLQNHLRNHPYYRQFGRRKLFSEGDIAKLSRAMENCPLGVMRNCPLLG